MELNVDDFPPVGDKSWRLPKNNSSQVWQYFRLHSTKDNEVFCMECLRDKKVVRITRKDKSTSALLHHLKLYHKTIVLRQTLRGQFENKDPAQPDIFTAMNLGGSFQENADQLVCQWIEQGDQAFAVVERDSLKKLVYYLNPKYKLHSRMYYTRRFEDRYEIRRTVWIQLVKELATSGRAFSLTLDHGKTVARQSYLDITLHWIDDKFTKVTIIAELEIAPSHTGKSIRSSVIKMLAAWGITDALQYITVDGAAKKAIESTIGDDDEDQEAFNDYFINWCLDHQLNWIVKHSLEKSPLNPLMTKSKDLVGVVNRSSTLLNDLEQTANKHNLPLKTLIQDGETRWSSSWFMTESLLYSKEAVKMTLKNNIKFKAHLLSSRQWNTLEDVQNILGDFAIVIKFNGIVSCCYSFSPCSQRL